MAESRLCLICGAVVDASKLSAHRQFHGDLERMTQVADDLRNQIRRLETRLRQAEERASSS